MKYDILMVVESPTKVKSIESYLKSLGYKNSIVLASYGHISNLLSKQNAIDPENNFKMIWQHTKQSEKALPKILSAAKESKSLIIATDPDREGEAIGWHIVNALKENHINLPTKRMLFYSITKQAIQEAMNSLQDMRESLISAYLARLGLDFLVGFYISPLLWRKLPGCLSAGRVQSAALRNIVELEYERVQFKPEQYYVVTGTFSLEEGVMVSPAIKKTRSKKTADLPEDNNIVIAKLSSFGTEKFERSCLYGISTEKLEEILAGVKTGNYYADSINKKVKYKSPPAPFITSTLQQDASNKLHLGPSMTMKIAQSLYEGVKLGTSQATGLITYMRTDNVHMSKEALTSCRKWIETNLNKKYLHSDVRVHKSKVRNAQEAHECIRPTDFSITPEIAKQYLDDKAYQVYKLIWSRAIASQMSNAEYEETTLEITNKQAVFKCTGNVQLFEGWLHFYKESADKNLPAIAQGQTLYLGNVETDSKETQPPSRYTAASLIARMEQLGIGRPSTYTRIVDTLLEREYIVKQEAYLVPTQRSWFLVAFLKKFFNKYVEYEFTAKLEEELDEISTGSLDWHNVLQQFWGGFSKEVGAVKDIRYDDMREDIESMWYDLFFQDNEDKCGKCGAKAQVRFWHGKGFISCSKYPDCDWVKGLTQTHSNEPKNLGIDPETGQNIRMLEGQYGPYLEWEATDKQKAKRVSIPPILRGKEISMEEAAKLKSMPFAIGKHPETDLELKVGFGRFGPYILYDGAFFPLKANPLEVDLKECLDQLAKAQLRQKTRAAKKKE